MIFLIIYLYYVKEKMSLLFIMLLLKWKVTILVTGLIKFAQYQLKCFNFLFI